MPSNPRVFISYCRSDGTAFATALRQKLEKENPEIALWQDVISERGGRDWWLQITEALDQVEYMVLVLTPDAMKSTTVRKEWRYARQKGVCVYPVQGRNNLDFSALPRWIRDLHIENLGYDEQRIAFISPGHWQKFINEINSRCETPRVPFMVEDLPEDFVQRPREFERLVQLLRDEKREEPIAITAALQGAGGFGKTTLARALCHDERIQEVFDDGILWVTLGENPGDLTGRVVDLIEVLSGERPGFKETEAASARLSELLADCDILIVIDDVWNSVHLRPFLNGGKRCARLITTRNRQTLPANTQPIDVDAMQQSEAVKLLAAGMRANWEHAERLRSLAANLGEWPLLLRLVNGVMRDRVQHQKQPLSAALDYAHKALDKRGLTAFDARDAEAREQAVVKTLSVSLDLLKDHERERFVELAIFPEDTDVPLATVAQLWRVTGGLDDFDAEELCSRLHGLSLLLGFDLTTRQIRLHDVMRKFLESSGLGKLEGGLTFLQSRLPIAATIHAKLVDAWVDHRLLPDTYAWRFLAYHLVQCNRADQLRRLLLDFDWIQAKLEITDINSLLADYDHLAGRDPDCAMVHGALRLSAHVLAKNADKVQLAGQLLGRLIGGDTLSIQGLVQKAGQWRSRFWLRPLKATLISPGGPLLRTLEGHRSSVLAVAIAPDGAQAVSGSHDHTLKVWNLKTGFLLHSLEGHSNSVRAMAITPDGAQAISASSDHTLKVWDLTKGKLLRSLQGHTRSVLAVIVSLGHGISASDDRTLKVWDLNTGRLLQSLDGHADSVLAVATSPDGRRAVSASADGTLRVWDLSTGSALHSLEGHRDRVEAVAITPDGSHAVSASHDTTLKVWDLEAGTLLHSLQGHRNSVWAAAITPDGAHVVSASGDRTLKVWDLKAGSLLRSLEGHSDTVWDVAIAPDGTHVVSGSADRTLKIWAFKTGRMVRSFEGHGDSVNAVAVTPDGAQVVSASSDHTVKVWDLKSEHHGQTEHPAQSVETVALTANSTQVVSASRNNILKFWDVKTRQFLHSFTGHCDWFRVAITPDGAKAVAPADDHTLKIWNLQTGKITKTMEGHNRFVNTVTITPNGAQAVSTSFDETLRVWDLKTGKLIHTLKTSSHIKSLTITAAGTRAMYVLGGSPSYIGILNLETGELLCSFGDTLIHAAAITPNGLHAVAASWDHDVMIWLVSASEDCTLKHWDLETGKLLHSLEGHGNSVQAVTLTPEGTQAISASSDHTVKVWDLTTGKLLATFSADGPVSSCVVTPDGKTIIAGDVLGRVHFLRIEQPQKT